jgi:hypothetical protein
MVMAHSSSTNQRWPVPRFASLGLALSPDFLDRADAVLG